MSLSLQHLTQVLKCAAGAVGLLWCVEGGTAQAQLVRPDCDPIPGYEQKEEVVNCTDSLATGLVKFDPKDPSHAPVYCGGKLQKDVKAPAPGFTAKVGIGGTGVAKVCFYKKR